MNGNTVKVTVALVFSLAILSGCATTRKSILQQNLESQGVEIKAATTLPGRVIVYRENTLFGLVVEYGVLKLSGKESELELAYIDPAQEYKLSKEDIHIYFKVDIYNPTGKNLVLTQTLVMDSNVKSVEFSGGNTPNSTFYFQVPLSKNVKKVKAKIVIGIKEDLYEIETLELVCIRK
ncbi:MAG: hypothetical protein U9M90_01815 [Patescibacteria group bacterium]|nr:hypothetical protein [Patescibacteria group bacterium]